MQCLFDGPSQSVFQLQHFTRTVRIGIVYSPISGCEKMKGNDVLEVFYGIGNYKSDNYGLRG